MPYILSVSEINRHIKGIFAKDLVLSDLWIKGEISNFKFHSSGHMYFTLKDEGSLLKCVMFKTYASTLRFRPDNGMKVIIKGYVSVFERDGQYQLYAETMQPDGLGSLHLAFEQLKQRLQNEGLFEPACKKKLPYLPKSIGVVTSATGAVIRDIVNILNRRYGNYQLKVFPVPVQGETAAKHVSRAIKKLNETNSVEVIILARGGGSLEELWAFNEEIVARSIFESKIPIISAIGHETDFTISDFVADMRAPTPSAAAELVIPEKALLKYRLININSRLRSSVLRSFTLKKSLYESIISSTALRQPYDRVYQGRMRLELLNKHMLRSLEIKLAKKRSDFSLLAGKLDALSPLKIINRGYCIAKAKKDGSIIRSIEGIKETDEIEINIKDGKLNCTVNNTESGGFYGKKK